jgi:hypothetical protein
MVQPPDDSHRQLRLMFHIGRRSEKVERAFVAALPCEQHDARAPVSMTLVSLPSRTLGAGYRLTLPMDEVPTDGVVFVTRRRRKASRRLIEREREKVRLSVRRPIDARLPWGDPSRSTNAKGRQDFDSRIASVNT